MSLEVGPVTKSKNGVDMLGLLHCLSTVAITHMWQGRAHDSQCRPIRSDLRSDSRRGSSPTESPPLLQPACLGCLEDEREILGDQAPFGPLRGCHSSSVLYEVGGDSRTPRPESSGPAEDSGRE